MEIKMRTGRISDTGVYKVLEGMKGRCYNPAHRCYKRYGGRGITICDEWLNDSCAFISWALENGYEKGLTIDRIDNNKGYSPENCRWVTNKENCRNMEKCHMVTLNGETKNWLTWCEELGISKKSIEHIVERHKISYEEAFDLKMNYVYNKSKWVWEPKNSSYRGFKNFR